MRRNWEAFERVENIIDELTEADKIELILDIIGELLGNEKIKAVKAYDKKEDFYNQERHIHENNYKILGEIWNSCQDLYIIEK